MIYAAIAQDVEEIQCARVENVEAPMLQSSPAVTSSAQNGS
jgi:hypothetical protein